LWLARDRLGKKPLYYYAGGARLVFGSEIKCLLTYPGVPRSLNRNVLPLYLTYGYVPAPETIFEGVRMIRPGHWLRVRDGEITEQPYWTPPAAVGQAGE